MEPILSESQTDEALQERYNQIVLDNEIISADQKKYIAKLQELDAKFSNNMREMNEIVHVQLLRKSNSCS